MAKVLLHETSPIKAQYHTEKKGYLRTFITVSGIIFLYFPLSIGLTFYQRWYLKRYGYPLFVVLLHLVTKLTVATVCRWVWQLCRRRPRVRLDWSTMWRKIAPMGIVSGLDIAFSNWGLELITVSLYTMTKSSTIVFILIFTIVFKLEEKSWTLIVIVLMIAGGLFLFTYQATQFDWSGFSLVLIASFCCGLRWTIAQLVMQKLDLGLTNPMDMIYHAQPWMIASILPFVISFEATNLWQTIHSNYDSNVAWTIALYLGLGSLIALFLELTEYLIISRMSSLSLSVASIFKEVCALTLAFEWNGDHMTELNFLGLLSCLGGIALHVFHKAHRVQKYSELVSTNLHSLDEASAHFLADVSSSSDAEDDNRDDSSTEVLFSVLRSRDR